MGFDGIGPSRRRLFDYARIQLRRRTIVGAALHMATEVAPAPVTKRPRGDLLGPILRWELITIPRRRRYYFIRVLYASVLLFVLWVVYDETVAHWGSRQPTISRLAQFSENFFYAFIFVQLGAVLLLTPAFVASGISVEKERRTLEFLFATDLSNREIVFGKLFARTLNLFAVLLAGVPILAFAGLFGGIDYARLMWVTAGSAALMMFIASLSLAISVHSRTTRQALTNSYALILILLFLPAGFMLVWTLVDSTLNIVNRDLSAQFTQFMMRPEVQSALLYALLVHPFGVAILATEPDFLVTATTGRADTAALVSIGANLCVATLLTLFSTARLRKAYRYEQAVAQKRRGFRRLFQPFRLFRPAVWQNWPLAWKEIHAGSYRSMGCVTRILLVFSGLIYYGIFFSNLYWWGAADRESGSLFVTMGNELFGGAAFLLVASRAATTISQERDRDCWVSLLSTPVTASEIIVSKWLAAMTPLFWTALFLLPVWLTTCLTGSLYVVNVLLIILVLAVSGAFLSAVGVYESLRRRTTVQAMGVTLAMGLVFFGFGQGILGSMVRSETIFSTMPWIALHLASLPASSREWRYFWDSETVSVAIISQVVFAVFAGALVVAAVRLFAKTTGRNESGRARRGTKPPLPRLAQAGR
jgi:ABC-type transport system involved in multi-copper enzyme maturation permease subunit